MSDPRTYPGTCQAIEDADVWATCDHDTGYGSCRDCHESATVGWAHETGRPGHACYDHDDYAAAVAHWREEA